MDSHLTSFSRDYSEARTRFRAAIDDAGGSVVALPIGGRGPDDDTLTIDVGWLGAAHPGRVFIHSCGVHGIEGYAGSAIQLAWLADASRRVARGAMDAVVFVHPVNPFGMAWRRRVNDHNVDLNRNCLRPDEAYTGAPDGYRRLNRFLNPDEDGHDALFLAKALLLVARLGMPALKQSIAAGQYEYPAGLFFGGSALEPEPRALLDLLRNRLAGVTHLIALDAHTGLGRFGRDTFLVDRAMRASHMALLDTLFGPRVASLDPHRSPAYTARGIFENVLHLAAPAADRLCVGQEFGTYPAIKVLRILRQENREFHHRAGGVSAHTRAALSECFVPADPAWRRLVVERGTAAIDALITSRP